MANPADYKRAAANLSARPDRGGMLGMAARMRAGMADGSAGSPGLIGLARTMQNQNVQQPQQVQMPRMGMMAKTALGVDMRPVFRKVHDHITGNTSTATNTDDTAIRAAGEEDARRKKIQMGMRRGGAVKKMAKGGSTASKRGDGIARKGKTKGRFV